MWEGEKVTQIRDACGSVITHLTRLPCLFFDLDSRTSTSSLLPFHPYSSDRYRTSQGWLAWLDPSGIETKAFTLHLNSRLFFGGGQIMSSTFLPALIPSTRSALSYRVLSFCFLAFLDISPPTGLEGKTPRSQPLLEV